MKYSAEYQHINGIQTQSSSQTHLEPSTDTVQHLWESWSLRHPTCQLPGRQLSVVSLAHSLHMVWHERTRTTRVPYLLISCSKWLSKIEWPVTSKLLTNPTEWTKKGFPYLHMEIIHQGHQFCLCSKAGTDARLKWVRADAPPKKTWNCSATICLITPPQNSRFSQHEPKLTPKMKGGGGPLKIWVTTAMTT